MSNNDSNFQNKYNVNDFFSKLYTFSHGSVFFGFHGFRPYWVFLCEISNHWFHYKHF